MDRSASVRTYGTVRMADGELPQMAGVVLELAPRGCAWCGGYCILGPGKVQSKRIPPEEILEYHSAGRERSLD
jgi:hypothetical protein